MGNNKVHRSKKNTQESGSVRSVVGKGMQSYGHFMLTLLYGIMRTFRFGIPFMKYWIRTQICKNCTEKT